MMLLNAELKSRKTAFARGCCFLSVNPCLKLIFIMMSEKL